MVLRLISKQLEATLPTDLGHPPNVQEVLAELSRRYGGRLIEKTCTQCDSKIIFDFNIGRVTHIGKQQCSNG
jgi:hypothetical protein